MQFITTPDAPAAGGHYSQAVVANGFVFVAGQLPVLPGGGMLEGVEAQARQALNNVAAILAAAGSGLDLIVSATVYVRDISLWPQINRVYAEVLGAHKPARTVTVSPQLHYDALVEMQVVALAG